MKKNKEKKVIAIPDCHHCENLLDCIPMGGSLSGYSKEFKCKTIEYEI